MSVNAIVTMTADEIETTTVGAMETAAGIGMEGEMTHDLDGEPDSSPSCIPNF